MKKHFRSVAIVLSIAMTVAVLAVCSACSPNKATKPAATPCYYLTHKANEWKSYTAAGEVPNDVKLVKTSTDKVYTLSVKLQKDDELLIALVGAQTKIGYDNLASELTQLVKGEGDNIKVGENGTYALTLDVTGVAKLAYEFTPDRTGEEVTVSDVTIAGDDVTLKAGENTQLTAEVTYSDGTKDSDVTWSTENDKIATVDATGKVTAVGVGYTNVTAKSKKDDTKSDSVKVTVAEAEVTGVTLDRTELLLELEAEAELTATVLPANATNKNVSWESSDSKIVSVDNGQLKALAYGTATITVTTVKNGKTATCVVTVRRPVERIAVSPASVKVTANQERTVTVLFTPTTATNKNYSVEVTEGSDKVKVEKAENGALSVKGLAVGTATVKVTSEEKSDATATLEIEVVPDGTAIASLDKSTVDLAKGGTVELNISFNAEIKSVTWVKEDGTALPDCVTVTPDSEDKTKATVSGDDFGYARIKAVVTDADDETHDTDVCEIKIADTFFYILGNVTGATGWGDPNSFETEAEAEEKGMLFKATAVNKYELTRHFTNGDQFQILGSEVGWDQITRSYYDAEKSDSGHSIHSNGKDIQIEKTGVFKLTIELDDELSYYVNLISVDLTGVTLSAVSGEATLKNGETRTLNVVVAPADGTVDKDNISVEIVSEEASIADYIEAVYDKTTNQITVTVKADPASTITGKIKCTVAEGIVGEYEFAILNSSSSVTAPTSVTFQQQGVYTLDYGTTATCTVKATVDADATNKKVKYYVKDGSTSGIEVDENTGTVTAKGTLGTFIVVAKAEGDESVTAEAQVTVYSTIWVTGVVNGDSNWQSATTPIDDRILTGDSANKVFTLSEVTLSKSDMFRMLYKYHTSESWTGINGTCYDAAHSTSDVTVPSSGNNDKNFVCGKKAVYTITVDLSGTTPVVTIVYVREADVIVYNDVTVKLMNGGTELTTTTVAKTEANKTLTVTYTFTEDMDQLTIKFNDTTVDTHNVSGDAVNLSWANNKWYHWESDDHTTKDQVYKYPGSATSGKTFTFTFTFNDDFTEVTGLVINEVTAA